MEDSVDGLHDLGVVVLGCGSLEMLEGLLEASVTQFGKQALPLLYQFMVVALHCFHKVIHIF